MTSIGCYETVHGFILKGGLMEFKVIECETFVNNRFRFCVLQTSFFFFNYHLLSFGMMSESISSYLKKYENIPPLSNYISV